MKFTNTGFWIVRNWSSTSLLYNQSCEATKLEGNHHKTEILLVWVDINDSVIWFPWINHYINSASARHWIFLICSNKRFVIYIDSSWDFLKPVHFFCRWVNCHWIFYFLVKYWSWLIVSSLEITVLHRLIRWVLIWICNYGNKIYFWWKR